MLRLKVITPQKIVMETDVESVTVPSFEGEITILPHHANLFSLLIEGIVTIRKKNEEDYLSIGGGYAETNGKDLRILVSIAYGQDEIDNKLTQQAIENAKKILSESKDNNERINASSVLRRSIIDSKLIKKRKKRPV